MSSLRCLYVATLVAGFIIGTGCDSSVDVVRSSDQFRYSMFGVLDVAADTQVIRIDPIADSPTTSPPTSLSTTVVLENLDTGQQVTLHDSLTEVSSTLVHNAWTTTPIQPDTRYRLSVRRDDQSLSTATTTTPVEPPEVNVGSLALPCISRETGNLLLVDIRNAAHVAAVHLEYPVIAPAETGADSVRYTVSFPHLDAITQKDNRFSARINYGPDLRALNPTPDEQGCATQEDFARPYARLIVAAGASDWPEWLDVPLNEISRPDAHSNVQGGHGYVGGIYSDTTQVPITTPIAR